MVTIEEAELVNSARIRDNDNCGLVYGHDSCLFLDIFFVQRKEAGNIKNGLGIYHRDTSNFNIKLRKSFDAGTYTTLVQGRLVICRSSLLHFYYSELTLRRAHLCRLWFLAVGDMTVAPFCQQALTMAKE